MKYLFTVLFSITVSFLNAQTTDSLIVTIDDRPAKLNTKTGKFTFIDNVKDSVAINSPKLAIDKKSSTANLHTVLKGDTFYSISQRYGISIAHLKSLNNITDNNLKIGQSLQIGYSNKAIINTPKTYTVNKGDTLYSIAKKNTISIEELKALNNLNTDAISIGQVLKLK